ncbi:MAG: hypothetical protein N2643_04780 [Endomicrobia bacterium]|nr:hypothetical protein [Endomicrobiia bacterium]
MKCVKMFFLLITILIISKNVYSYDYIDDLFLISASPKSLALSQIASFNDISSSLFSNPSALSYFEKSILSLNYFSFFENSFTRTNVSFAYKIPNNLKLYSLTKLNTLGISLFYDNTKVLDTTNLIFFDINGNGIKDEGEEIIYDEENVDYTTATNLLLCFSVARKINIFSLGLAFKYLNLKIFNHEGYFSTIDFSLSYLLDNLMNLSISLVLNNLINSSIVWNTKTKEKKDLVLGIILSYKKDWNKNINTLVILEYRNSNSNFYSVGLELEYLRKYYLRSGYGISKLTDSRESPNFSFGFGLMITKSLVIDYAIRMQQVLQENIQSASISYSF